MKTQPSVKTLVLIRLKPAARLVALNDWVTEHACDYPIVTGDDMRDEPGDVRLDAKAQGWEKRKGYPRWLIGHASQPLPQHKKWWHDFDAPVWATSLDAVWPLAVAAFPAFIHWHEQIHNLTCSHGLDGPFQECITERRFSTLPEALCVALLRRRGVEVVL